MKTIKALKKIKGFTLLEIVIVIVIMSIILATSMKFGSNQIVQLKYQTVKENFIGDFEKIYVNSLASNYFDKKLYDFLEIKFSSGNNKVFYNYSGSEINFQGSFEIEKMSLIDIKIQEKNLEDVYVKIVPYSLGCEIFYIEDQKVLTGSMTSFSLQSNDKSKKYCFEIKSNNCKLIEVTCN